MRFHLVSAALPLWLAGCVEGTVSSTTTSTTSRTPTPAEQACLRDVTATTNNGDVVLLGSEFSEAGTLVTVGVGPDRARWECIGYAEGSTAGITALNDEGAL